MAKLEAPLLLLAGVAVIVGLYQRLPPPRSAEGAPAPVGVAPAVQSAIGSGVLPPSRDTPPAPARGAAADVPEPMDQPASWPMAADLDESLLDAVSEAQPSGLDIPEQDDVIALEERIDRERGPLRPRDDWAAAGAIEDPWPEDYDMALDDEDGSIGSGIDAGETGPALRDDTR